MIDGVWVSCDRALMQQPALHLGIIVYWTVLHALLASFVFYKPLWFSVQFEGKMRKAGALNMISPQTSVQLSVRSVFLLLAVLRLIDYSGKGRLMKCFTGDWQHSS